jgi:hypothetical protein
MLKSFKCLGVVNTLVENVNATSKILNFKFSTFVLTLAMVISFQDVNFLWVVTHQSIGPHTLQHSLNQ